jgi:diguanylate cyclase (GGDEF)-like protein
MVIDTFGHAPGDELLGSVAERLRSVLRPADTAARFGGDEFAILLEDALSREDVAAVAERIVTALKPHFVIERQEVAVHASIGVAIAAGSAVTAEELLRRADSAMYWAKVQGKGSYEIYDAGMIEGSGHRLQVRTELERALVDGDLRVHYQPIVDVRSGDIRGVEALVRWEHPERGWILPSEFIGIAEESGLIADVGDFVLREACTQMQRWGSTLAMHEDFQLHVNVSPRQLRSDHLMEQVRTILAETRLDPWRLVIEMTESFVGEHGDVARERMRELKTLGVGLAIDDFGTGYSSLAILQDMPFDILKVDRAFIDGVADDPRRRAFTEAIFGLGATLGLRMVAEGVEREQQREALMALGCTLAQGYLFARPVPASEINALLTREIVSASVVPLRLLEDDGDVPLVKASLPA